jgi:fructose/tagatose bisphosphate aldolase
MDNLVRQAVFGNPEEKDSAYRQIWNTALENGSFAASINDFYLSRGREELALDFTVPAINVRGMTYDFACTVFKKAIEKKVGALIFEIARSEMKYTSQDPQEFVSCILAASVKTDFKGPVFIQGDHFQLKPGEVPGQPLTGEMDKMKELIKKAVEAGFYNIDLDASTLVDYSQALVGDQQKSNYELTSELAQYTRSLQPENIQVSLGAEIGHIGGKNSTIEELDAFMEGFKKVYPQNLAGLTKISIQTGTHHGGVVLPDGTLAKVSVDFKTLKDLAQASRKQGMAGTVQHGASTLPEDFFNQFPKSEAVEVHLATEFQNIIFNHPQFPKELLDRMYAWIDQNLQKEKKPGKTDQQFHYELRKKAWGAFKKDCWDLPEDVKSAIFESLSNKIGFLFKELNVENTQEMVNKIVKQGNINKK